MIATTHQPTSLGAHAARTQRSTTAATGWLAVAAVAAAPGAEALRVVIERPHVTLDGDEALIDLGALRAQHLLQLVGPYSRVGFHQPGPAVFYLLAPFVRLIGPGGAGLFLGALAINGAALMATVAVLWRVAGPRVALWSAAAIDGYCLCVRVGTLREPWNPYLVMAPMVLYVVLWAVAMTGSGGAAWWAAVVGSYEVQTHIATAGFVVTTSVVVMVRFAMSMRRRDPSAAPSGSRRVSRICALTALSLIWLAPIVELRRDHPNNLSLLWEYFSAAHPTPSVHQALEVAGNALTIMPFGYRDYALALPRSSAELGIGALLLVAAMLAAVTLGVRHRHPLSLALTAASLIGIAAGTVSLLFATAPLYLYFAVWMAFVPLGLLLAIGVALLDPGASRPRAVRRQPVALAAVAIALAAITLHSDLHMASIATTTGAGPWPARSDQNPVGRSQAIRDIGVLSGAAETVLTPSDRWVNFELNATSPWPYVAGMVLALDQRGVNSTVSPASWELYFGHERSPGRPVSAHFEVVALRPGSPTVPAGARLVAVVDGYALAYWRTSP